MENEETKNPEEEQSSSENQEQENNTENTEQEPVTDKSAEVETQESADIVEEKVEEEPVTADNSESEPTSDILSDMDPDAQRELDSLRDEDILHIAINPTGHDPQIVAYIDVLLEKRNLRPFLEEIKNQIVEEEEKAAEEFNSAKEKVNMANKISLAQGSQLEMHFVMELDQNEVEYYMEVEKAENETMHCFYFADETFERVTAMLQEIENDDESEDAVPPLKPGEKKGCLSLAVVLVLFVVFTAFVW